MSELENKLSIITKAIEDKKGIDMQVLDISKFSSIADSFVITSGNSSSQVTSIADEIESKMFLAGYEKISNKEGYKSARWILLDFGDVVAHVFHKDEREFYNLERLWSHHEKSKSIKDENEK